MAVNLITSVRTEIARLKKEIGRRTSQLASLKGELKRHQRVYQLLQGKDRRVPGARRHRGKARKGALVNWNSVLQGLPNPFTLEDLSKQDEAKGKSSVYLRQIAVRWAKQGKTKRVGRGKYQKVQQRKPRAAARRRRK